MLDIFWVKIIGAVVAAVLTMAAGFLPRIDAVRVNPMVLELLNVLSPSLSRFNIHLIKLIKTIVLTLEAGED